MAEDGEWIEKLKEWVEQVDQLLARIEQGRSLSPAQTAEARQELAALKGDLTGEAQRVSKLARDGKLRGFAATDYEPAVTQAAAELTIRSNSTPGPAW